MKAYVGVTDTDWYDFLRLRPDLDEVNFWQPSGGRRFGALEAGDLFLFKLHYPVNRIVGGATFVNHASFPAWFVWETFGEKNGASSFDEMRRRIERYRGRHLSEASVDEVGCIVLEDPFFLPPADWIDPPRDWAPNIVQGKTYTDASEIGRDLIDSVLVKRSDSSVAETPPPYGGRIFGEPSLVRRRRGQGVFQVLVVQAYDRRCAVSGEKALPVLQAAHIRPVSEGGLHETSNGLLLRSDIHTLFDRGYATITLDGRFIASRRLKTDFNNGEPYHAFERTPIIFPPRTGDKPSAEALQWHNDTVFLR